MRENDELEAFLARAAAELSPTDDDRARVFARVAPLVAAPMPSVRRWRWLSHALVALAFGGAGYVLGLRHAPLPGQPAPVIAASPAPAAPAKALIEAAPVTVPEVTSAPLPSEKKPSPRAAAGTPIDDAGVEDALSEEVRALGRVERALRQQNPRFALALLHELDVRVPRGQLLEERFAAATMARCALEDGKPTLRREFARRYPRSAYSARVESACGTSTD